MKGRSGRGVTGPLAVAVSSAVITSSPTLIPAAPTAANQQADQNSVENGRSESATTAQISTQVISGGAQPSTPRTPTSPPEHGANTPNPPTPGNTSSNNSTLVDTSPQYVTITAEGPGNRSYASLTPVNSAVVDGETVTGETVGENAAYVTYVEGSDTLYAAAAAAAAAASANGQTMTYPVYTVGDSTATAIYSPGGSTTQYYTTSTSTPTVAYTQESGVTYLVPSTNNNNSISLEAADGQHNISHATRVSPATQAVMKSQRKRYTASTSQKIPIQHINYPPAKIRRIESFNSQNSTKLLNSFSAPLIPPPVIVTLESSSGESDLEDSEEDRNSSCSPALLLGTDLRLNHFDRKIKRMIATAGSGPCLDKFKISDNSNVSASNHAKRNEMLSPSYYGQSYPKSKDLDIIPITNFLNSDTKSSTVDITGGHGHYYSSGEGNMSGSSVAKFCPITVQWLLENYETAEGVSLPRSTLYYHYLRHCNEHKLDPVNAASFGKLIRSVFLGLRTRRLGTRGNSKYHYYGIRLKPNSPLVNVTENGEIALSQSQSNSPSQNGSASASQGETTVVEGGGRSCTIVSNGTGNGAAKRLKTSKGEHYEVGHNVTGNLADPYTIQFLGDPSGALDNLPDLDMKINIPANITVDDLLIFRTLYREHCESLLDCLSSFQLSQVESYWRNFWRNSLHSDAIEVEYEKMMPKNKLVMLCMVKEVQNFIRETDFQFYQNIVGILLPDVLRPIPSSMTQAIRNFAKTLESWLSGAMTGYPDEVVAMKLAGVNALAQTLRRYTSLNHLAQAARAVLQNQNQIAQMLSDLNRVDFHNVEEQASWVCGCDGDMVPSLEQDFKATLAQQQTLEQWATWLEGVVDRILRPHLTSPRFVQAARHFLLKWSFYSSLVIRDLTLRSAASFGSFHLLRLLYDEYMFYLVEHRVAQVTGIVPIAVIGKKIAGENVEEPSSQSPTFMRTGSTDEEAHITTLTVEYVDSKPQIALLTRRHSSIELATAVNGNSMNGSENSSSAPPSPVVASSDISPPATTSATIVTSTANVNVHQINAAHGGGVNKTEMKRVKNFLAA